MDDPQFQRVRFCVCGVLENHAWVKRLNDTASGFPVGWWESESAENVWTHAQAIEGKWLTNDIAVLFALEITNYVPPRRSTATSVHYGGSRALKISS
jgi:hypothetical protein